MASAGTPAGASGLSRLIAAVAVASSPSPQKASRIAA